MSELPQGYADLAYMPEDERIELIARYVNNGYAVGVVVDDLPGKPERYMAKLEAHGCKVVSLGKGPPGIVTLRVSPSNVH